MQSFYRIYILTVLVLILSSCSKESSVLDYFPVEKDIYWVYSGYQNNWRLVNNDFIYVIHNSDYQDLGNGRSLLTKKRHDGTSVDYLIDTKLGVLTENDGVSSATNFDMTLPRQLSSEQQWARMIRTQLIPEFACGYCTTTSELKQQVTLNYSVLSSNVSTSTPMKTFDNCILIEGKGAETIDAGDSMGNVEVEVVTREWYAPDVGLVKLIWHEQTNAEVLKVGEYRLELKDMYYK